MTIRFPLDSVVSAIKLKKADVKNVMSVAFIAQYDFLTRPLRFNRLTFLSPPSSLTKSNYDARPFNMIIRA